jgi:hypothetical protein
VNDTSPEPTLAELELREALYEAMDGNLRMSRRRELLKAYRDTILASVPEPAPAAVVPAADRAALRDRIAASLSRYRKFFYWDPSAADMLRADLAEHLAADLGLLPAPADRAAVLREAADTTPAETRDECRAPVASGRCPHGCDVSICPCLACEADQLGTEEAQQPERCAHCGHTVCDGDGPCGALSGSDFCTCPGPTGPAQPGTCALAECGHSRAAHREGDDPVTPGLCADCGPDDDRHDYRPAPGRSL